MNIRQKINRAKIRLARWWFEFMWDHFPDWQLAALPTTVECVAGHCWGMNRILPIYRTPNTWLECPYCRFTLAYTVAEYTEFHPWGKNAWTCEYSRTNPAPPMPLPDGASLEQMLKYDEELAAWVRNEKKR